VSTIISELPPEPTYRAVLTIPAGLDETHLAVADFTGVIAEMTWRPSDNYQPGPATWDLGAAPARLRSPVAIGSPSRSGSVARSSASLVHQRIQAMTTMRPMMARTVQTMPM
jgi:hypothetical protein